MNYAPADVIDMMIRKYTAIAEEETPPRFRGATATDRSVLAWCEALIPAEPTYCRTPGRSLLLLGPVGVGKTHQAYGALKHLAERGCPNRPRAVSAVNLYASLRPQPGVNTEEVFQSYAEAGVLFVDDLGTEKGSEWVEQTNFRLINHRYEHELPTIITSNFPAKEFGAAVGERAASRLIEMSDVVSLTGADRRRMR